MPTQPLLGAGRLARVQAHADAHGPLRERSLPLLGGLDGLARIVEREEERVSLRVDLGTATGAARLAQHAPVFREHGGIPVA